MIEQSGVASTKKEQLRNVTETLSPKTGNKKKTEKKNNTASKQSVVICQWGGGGLALLFQAEHRPQFMRGYKTFS